MRIYTVKHNESGLYSSGSMNPSFHNNGKVWNSKGRVNSHLQQFLSNRDFIPEYTKKWTVVGYDLDKIEMVDSYNAYSYLHRLRELRKISNKYGGSTATLVDRLEKENVSNKFIWGAITDFVDPSGESKTLPHFVRSLNIPSTNFRYCKFKGTTTVAFENKDDLLLFKLSYAGGVVHYVDLHDMSALLLT